MNPTSKFHKNSSLNSNPSNIGERLAHLEGMIEIISHTLLQMNQKLIEVNYLIKSITKTSRH